LKRDLSRSIKHLIKDNQNSTKMPLKNKSSQEDESIQVSASILGTDTQSSTSKPALKVSPSLLGSLTEICLVTPDYKKTIDGLAQLGVGPFQVFHLNAETCHGLKFRGEAGDFDIIACFANQGGMAVEIMQPFSGKSLMQEYLDRNDGRAGIQHIAWAMKDGLSTQQRVESMAERGIAVAMEGTWIGRQGTCQVCLLTYFHQM
jgi:hypothetical protein